MKKSKFSDKDLHDIQTLFGKGLEEGAANPQAYYDRVNAQTGMSVAGGMPMTNWRPAGAEKAAAEPAAEPVETEPEVDEESAEPENDEDEPVMDEEAEAEHDAEAKASAGSKKPKFLDWAKR